MMLIESYSNGFEKALIIIDSDISVSRKVTIPQRDSDAIERLFVETAFLTANLDHSHVGLAETHSSKFRQTQMNLSNVLEQPISHGQHQ
jgi:hypothetical protein